MDRQSQTHLDGPCSPAADGRDCAARLHGWLLDAARHETGRTSGSVLRVARVVAAGRRARAVRRVGRHDGHRLGDLHAGAPGHERVRAPGRSRLPHLLGGDTRGLDVPWGPCTSGSTGHREGETRPAAPTTRSTGSDATTSTTTQTGPAITGPGSRPGGVQPARSPSSGATWAATLTIGLPSNKGGYRACRATAESSPYVATRQIWSPGRPTGARAHRACSVAAMTRSGR
jgi:hypothetical protein